jgi:hypothetical protein
MSKYRSKISLIIILVSLFSLQAFSQQRDSLALQSSQKIVFKPQLHYSLGSSYMFIPHVGSVTGVTIAPFLSVPVSPKWSLEGGIIAGHYYSSLGSNHELKLNGAFNEVSIFGSASYHVNSKLTLYGAGIKHVTTDSPFNMLPKSSYIIGSNYNFGNFSVGLSVQMSKWNDNISPFDGSQGFYSPYERTATFLPFGR